MPQQIAIYSIVSSNLAFSRTNYSKADDILIVYWVKNSTTWKKSSWNPVQLWAKSLQNGLQTYLFASDSIDANANALLMLGVNKQYHYIAFNSERYR